MEIAYETGLIPTDAQLRELYDSVGWSAYTSDMLSLRGAIENSSTVVTAWDGDQLVGLARLISDGYVIAYLQDVLVNPSHQRRGIATELVRQGFDPYGKARQHVLITDDEPYQRAFYESLGFTEAHDFTDGESRAFLRFS